jgi:hypothetical protein
MLCGILFENLADGTDQLHKRSSIEQFANGKDGSRNPETRQPSFRIGQRAEPEFRTGAQVRDSFTDERKFRAERGYIMLRRERFSGAASGRTGGVSTYNFFQTVELKDLFC